MNINRLITGTDDTGTPLGILAVNNDDIKGVTFFYEQDNILEWIRDSGSESIPTGVLNDFIHTVRSSNLPRLHSFRNPVVIPNYAGMCLANAIDFFYVAMSQHFRPMSSWPCISSITGYSYVMYLYTLDPDEKEENFPLKSLQYYNYLFAYLKSETDCGVQIVHSKTQMRNIIRDLDFLEHYTKESILESVEDSILPEDSYDSPVELEHCLAKFVYRIVSYRYYMGELVDSYRNRVVTKPAITSNFSLN